MSGSGLVMLQTTINCLNNTLYDGVTSSSLLAWQRVRVANQLSKSGPEWATNSMRYNSGTYNNQYMVIDTKLWEAGKPLKGLFSRCKKSKFSLKIKTFIKT